MLKKNIVVFASGPVGALFLEKIFQYNNFKIQLVIACNSTKNPFYKEDRLDPVKEFCLKNNLKLVFNLDTIVGRKYDLGLSFSNFHILKNKHISVFSHGIINFHGAPINWYKGSAVPVYHILNKDTLEWGYTYHYVDKGLDTGDIIKQILYKIPSNLTSEEINQSAVVNALRGTHDFFDYIFSKSLKPERLPNQKAAVTIKRKNLEKLSILDGNFENNINFEKIMRAFDWPKVFKHPMVVVNGKKYRLVPEEKYDEMLNIYRNG